MLAATTSETLTLTETVTLKRGPSSISPCLDLLETPTACSWTPDNACLYLVSGLTLRRYEPSSNTIRDVYTHSDLISHMVARSATCVILSSGNEIYILEGSQIIQTLSTHKSDVKSLSLSNDNSLLASNSSGAVHIHNLTHGSHTVMRGLTDKDAGVSTFDFHLRTRLLVVSGKMLLVYDITRPSGPTKTVSLNESATGDVIPAACSPFSKTLVAVATTGGFLGLIDLEKEKALIRTLNVKAQLSTVAFSPEGTAIYLGTETGKILVVDLRGLDKPPKAVTLSETGCPIRTINIQRKAKGSINKTPVPVKKPTADSISCRRTASVQSPVRKAITPSSPLSRRAVSSVSPSKKTADAKKILSPVRDPHGNAGLSPPKPSISLKKVSLGSGTPRRTRTLPSSTAPVPSHKDAISSATGTKTTSHRRPRTLSSASHVSNKEARSSVSTRSSSSATRAQRDDVLPSATCTRPPSSSRTSLDHEHNDPPSPDIPDMRVEPITPPVHKQRTNAIDILGLGTLDVDNWISPSSEDVGDRDRGKTVEFQAHEDAKATMLPLPEERDRVLSMQISPRRPTRDIFINAPPVLDGPLNSSIRRPGSPTGGASAHELLRTIVQDVMFDFQRETKAEMVGLHLDLLRMNRVLKMELRALMDEYVGDLKDLREENQRLRLENERLRRNAY